MGGWVGQHNACCQCSTGSAQSLYIFNEVDHADREGGKQAGCLRVGSQLRRGVRWSSCRVQPSDVWGQREWGKFRRACIEKLECACAGLAQAAGGERRPLAQEARWERGGMYCAFSAGYW